MNSGPSKPVSFRLPAPLVRELKQRAKRDGHSLHEAAKQIVSEQLVNGEGPSVEEQISELGRQLTRLRGDVATAVQVILVKAGRIEQSDADEWVQKNFFAED